MYEGIFPSGVWIQPILSGCLQTAQSVVLIEAACRFYSALISVFQKENGGKERVNYLLMVAQDPFGMYRIFCFFPPRKDACPVPFTLLPPKCLQKLHGTMRGRVWASLVLPLHDSQLALNSPSLALGSWFLWPAGSHSWRSGLVLSCIPAVQLYGKQVLMTHQWHCTSLPSLPLQLHLMDTLDLSVYSSWESLGRSFLNGKNAVDIWGTTPLFICIPSLFKCKAEAGSAPSSLCCLHRQHLHRTSRCAGGRSCSMRSYSPCPSRKVGDF